MKQNHDEPLSGEHTAYDSLKRACWQLLEQTREHKREIRETLAALFLSIITGIIAGLFLGNSQETLLLIPGLIVLIPAAMGMRGSIGGALGSRLGTCFHLGIVDKFTLRNNAVKANIYSSIALSF